MKLLAIGFALVTAVVLSFLPVGQSSGGIRSSHPETP